MGKDVPVPDNYSCTRCGSTGEWNDDCIECMVARHVEDKKEIYARMGTVDRKP